MGYSWLLTVTLEGTIVPARLYEAKGGGSWLCSTVVLTALGFHG
jgi:hypothetical protein